MTVAVVVSKGVEGDISKFVPEGITELVTAGNGARIAQAWADKRRIPRLIIRSAGNIRLSFRQKAKMLADIADVVVGVWNGASRQAEILRSTAEKAGKPVSLFYTKHLPALSD